MTETGRDYWMRVYAGQAMQALIGKARFDETQSNHIDSLADRAVLISKALLDRLEATRAGWVKSHYTGMGFEKGSEGHRPNS